MQTITINDLVVANRLAIKEGRLQAVMEPPKDAKTSPNGGWLYCVYRLAGHDNAGCAIGVVLKDSNFTKEQMADLMTRIMGISELFERGFLSAKSKLAERAMIATQYLHDNIAARTKNPFECSIPDDYGNIVLSMRTAGDPTIEDFVRWLDLLEENAAKLESA